MNDNTFINQKTILSFAASIPVHLLSPPLNSLLFTFTLCNSRLVWLEMLKKRIETLLKA